LRAKRGGQSAFQRAKARWGVSLQAFARALPFRPKGGKRDRAPGLAGTRSTDVLREAKTSAALARHFPPIPAKPHSNPLTPIKTHAIP